MTHLAAVASEQREHLVQFYENSDFLIDGVGRYIAEGLTAGEAGVVIATPPHRESLEKTLTERGLDPRGARQGGRYMSLDAGETLSRFWNGASLQESLFQHVIGGYLSWASQVGRLRRVRVYGEMVALLWSRGDRAAAVELERLWNDLGRRHAFSLLCAYPIKDFSGQAHEKDFREICTAHTGVHPAESYSAARNAEERSRAIAALQQKAVSLETEVVRRRQAEEDLKKKVDQLAEADRRKDEFVAMLGHELRNPLSPIVMSLRLLKMRLGDPDVLTRSVELIERQTQRLIRLVDDLLDVSRITRGTIELKEDTVGLTSLVERAVEQARPLLEERGHRLSLHLPEEPVWLRADPTRLEQALANLLINAAKYTDLGGRIEVFASRNGSELKISIRDNGMGLAPEARERVFDLFVQSPTSASRMPGGLGIGLTVVRRLIQLHGGTVEAFSEGPGRGSEFVVRLPISDPSPPADGRPSSLSAATSPSARRRILVVDDNADAADGLSELLRSLGHEVSTAQDGFAAIDLARWFQPDLVFLDLAMPGMDGREVAIRLRSEVGLRAAMIVAVTGYGREIDRRLSAEAGFDHHLVKPLEPETVERLLRTSRNPPA